MSGDQAPEELNLYAAFQLASLYSGRIVDPAQTRAVVQTAICTRAQRAGTHGALAAGQ